MGDMDKARNAYCTFFLHVLYAPSLKSFYRKLKKAKEDEKGPCFQSFYGVHIYS